MSKNKKKKNKNLSSGKNNKEKAVVQKKQAKSNLSKVSVDVSESKKSATEKEFEVYPVIETTGDGEDIKASRTLTKEETDAILNNSKEQTSHIHPSIIKSVLEEDQKKKKRIEKHRKRVFRKRIFYALLWLYLLIRIFITDVDYLIVDGLFGVSVLHYSLGRVAIVLAVIIVVWKKVGNKRFWKTFFSFLSFPIYPGFWQVLKSIMYAFPKYLLEKKQTYFLYVYTEYIVELVVRFKVRMLGYIIFWSGVLLSIFSNYNFLLGFSICLLLISQWRHLAKRWNELFGPLKVFQIELNPSSLDSQPISVSQIESQIKEDVKKQGKNGKKAIVKEVEQYVLYSEMLSGLDGQVKKVLSSQSYLKNFVVKSFISFFYAVVVFGCINFALYKMNSSNFSLEGMGSVGLFEFIYYGFFSIFSEGVDVEPNTRVAKFFRMVGVFVGVIINFLILAVYFTVNSSRYKKNLEGISVWANHFSTELNDKMKNKYSRDSGQNKNWLQEQGSEIIKNINELKKFFAKKS